MRVGYWGLDCPIRLCSRNCQFSRLCPDELVVETAQVELPVREGTVRESWQWKQSAKLGPRGSSTRNRRKGVPPLGSPVAFVRRGVGSSRDCNNAKACFFRHRLSVPRNAGGRKTRLAELPVPFQTCSLLSCQSQSTRFQSAYNGQLKQGESTEHEARFPFSSTCLNSVSSVQPSSRLGSAS